MTDPIPNNESTPESIDPTVYIAVMGATGAGKTQFVNTASGCELRVGKSLLSCTDQVQFTEPFPLNRREVVLIDTPGFDDSTLSEADILAMISTYLAATYQNGIRLSGIVYVHRISDNRMGGIAMRNFRMFRKLCGDTTLQNVVIMTNMWGQVTMDEGNEREKELRTNGRFFQPALDKGARMLRHDDTRTSAERILLHLIDNRPLALRIQRELVDEKKTLGETDAGAELSKELVDLQKKHEAEIAEMKKEAEEALKEKDKEAQMELAVAIRESQARVDQLKAQHAKLAMEFFMNFMSLAIQLATGAHRTSGYAHISGGS